MLSFFQLVCDNILYYFLLGVQFHIQNNTSRSLSIKTDALPTGLEWIEEFHDTIQPNANVQAEV